MRGTSLIPTDYEIFAGLDVDKTSIAVTFTTHHGFLRSLRMPDHGEPLGHYVRTHCTDQRVAVADAAGPTGSDL